MRGTKKSLWLASKQRIVPELGPLISQLELFEAKALHPIACVSKLHPPLLLPQLQVILGDALAILMDGLRHL